MDGSSHGAGHTPVTDRRSNARAMTSAIMSTGWVTVTSIGRVLAGFCTSASASGGSPGRHRASGHSAAAMTVPITAGTTVVVVFVRQFTGDEQEPGDGGGDPRLLGRHVAGVGAQAGPFEA